MIRFSIVALNDNIDKYKNEIINLLKWEYSSCVDNIDYLFVFGGDGTFLECVKKYLKLPIKIIFVNVGKLGFLSRTKNIHNKYKDSDFCPLPYLEYVSEKNTHNVINELSFATNTLVKSDLYINKFLTKDLLYSKFFAINSLGTTGLARSYNYPILSLTDNYLIHFLEEPIYKYYKPFLQPMILGPNHDVIIDFKKEVIINLKIDNKIFNDKTTKIHIKLKYSNALIYKLNDFKSIIKNIKTLL